MTPERFQRAAFLLDRFSELAYWARLEGKNGPARKAAAIVLQAYLRVRRGQA